MINTEAALLGFGLCRITSPELPTGSAEDLFEYLRQGHHGTMHWMAETFERRRRPQALWSKVRSVIMLAMNYTPANDPLEILQHRDQAAISVYAQNRDYHDIVKGKLKSLASKLVSKAGGEVKVFVDTAPVMEKPLAEKAGIGWQGKHTNVVSRQLGSWFFLGSIFTTAELPFDAGEENHCGSCRACLDICPTAAFTAAHQIDARRCISYLTIEHKGPIPIELRPLLGNRVFGCDDCLAVCPWNKFAKEATEAKLIGRQELKSLSLRELAKLDDAAFRRFFSANPVKRIGRNRFIRNVLTAMGNAADSRFANDVVPHLNDDNPLVRGAAIWALGQLDPTSASELARRRAADEMDASVVTEWKLVLSVNGASEQ